MTDKNFSDLDEFLSYAKSKGYSVHQSGGSARTGDRIWIALGAGSTEVGRYYEDDKDGWMKESVVVHVSGSMDSDKFKRHLSYNDGVFYKNSDKGALFKFPDMLSARSFCSGLRYHEPRAYADSPQEIDESASTPKYYLVSKIGLNLTAHTTSPYFNTKDDAEAYRSKFSHVPSIKASSVVKGTADSVGYVTPIDESASTPTGNYTDYESWVDDVVGKIGSDVTYDVQDDGIVVALDEFGTEVGRWNTTSDTGEIFEVEENAGTSRVAAPGAGVDASQMLLQTKRFGESSMSNRIVTRAPNSKDLTYSELVQMYKSFRRDWDRDPSSLDKMDTMKYWKKVIQDHPQYDPSDLQESKKSNAFTGARSLNESFKVNDTARVKKYQKFIQSGNTIQPAGDVQTIPRLEAGVYSVDTDMNGTAIISRKDVRSDSLLRFDDVRHESVMREINDFWSLAENFKQLGLTHKRGVLMWGAPGTGKSCIIKQVMEDCTAKDCLVFFPSSLSYLRPVLEQVRDVEPSRNILVVLEDVDEMVQYSEKSMLELFDGDSQFDNILFLGTTNYPERLPPRVMRSGRFDTKVEIKNPPREGRLAFFKSKLDGKLEGVDYEHLADVTEDFSFAQLREFLVSVYGFKQDPKSTVTRIRRNFTESKSLNESKRTAPRRNIVESLRQEFAIGLQTEGYRIYTDLTHWKDACQEAGYTFGVNKGVSFTAKSEGREIAEFWRDPRTEAEVGLIFDTVEEYSSWRSSTGLSESSVTTKRINRTKSW